MSQDYIQNKLARKEQKIAKAIQCLISQLEQYREDAIEEDTDFNTTKSLVNLLAQTHREVHELEVLHSLLQFGDN